MRKQPVVLVVDDDDVQRHAWGMILQKEGLHVLSSSTSKGAFQLIEDEMPDVVLADLKIDEHTGIDILQRSKQKIPNSEVIIITGYGTITSAVEAMQLGAYTYLSKPVEPSHLVHTVQQAFERKSLYHQLRNLKSRLDAQYGFDMIVANSTVMRKTIDLAQRIATSNAPILITGESGTGKEVFARCIHQLSDRKDGPLVSINCSAIPEQLLESELFGHVKGSFTGAYSTKIGLIEEADNGTLILDEIGDMPLQLQAKLLRVIQEGELRRVGETRSIPVDFRLIAITNRDLRSLIAKSAFREDLFYRLNVFSLQIPALRSRKEDILPLAQEFLTRFATQFNRPSLQFSPAAAIQLQKEPWLGNVRELENTVQRAVILCASDLIDASDLTPVFQETPETTTFIGKTLEEIEAEAIRQTLKHCKQNQTEAAKRLGIGRNTLWRKLKEYHINPEE